MIVIGWIIGNACIAHWIMGVFTTGNSSDEYHCRGVISSVDDMILMITSLG